MEKRAEYRFRKKLTLGHNKKVLFFLCLLIFSAYSYGQLPDFDLVIEETHETCPGNATMTFSTQGGAGGATFLYTVYLHPNLTIPISSSVSDFIGSLEAGTYTIVSLQTLGSQSNSVQQEVIIENLISPLTYTVSSLTYNCAEGGQVIITATSGNPAQYEIISGPVTRPLQDSNIFESLPGGTYNIRVFDECGQGIVTTYTLVINDDPPVVSPPIFNDVFEGDCDSVIITNTVSYEQGSAISYPLTIVYTLYPPNGDPPIETTYVFETGETAFLELIHEFPLYDEGQYTYDIQVTNGCGIQYGNIGMPVNPTPAMTHTLVPLPCGESYLTLQVTNYMPTLTINFLDAPEGYNPVDFNSTHPGPFDKGNIAYGGEENPMPEGSYLIEVTDACGRSSTDAVEIENVVPEPVVTGRNNGCFAILGRITVTIPEREIISATITEAPEDYTETLPEDVSGSINNSGRLILSDMPLGSYTIIVIDECGEEYEVTVEVPVFVERDFTATASADCTVGVGGIRVASGNGALVSLSMISAPPAFGGTLPLDVTENINSSSGDFFMDNLPAGNYTFFGTDICGIERTVSVTVTGYEPGQDTFIFDPNCNSFDIHISDSGSSIGSNPTYWLQKLNEETGEWGHPQTGVVYTEGTFPEATNSRELQNSQITYNLTYTGFFRVVKAFESVGNGQPLKLCFEVLGEFEYYDGVSIENIYNLSCLYSPDDNFVESHGVTPLTYRIEEKDGVPFLIDNGTNNVFSGLEPGVYKFVVEDTCGSSSTEIENINLLPDLVEANDPGNMLICIEPGDSYFQEFDLSLQDDGILGEQSPTSYTITYHLTQEDAEADTNPLPELYTNVSNPQIIYARITHNHISICHDVVSFGLRVSEYPVLDINETNYICENNGPVIISAGQGFDSYLWSTGQTTPSISVYEPGTYSVTVGRDYGDRVCESSSDITVLPSGAATVTRVDTEDWTYEDNIIAVSVTGSGSYEYSLDGITYQESPVFDELQVGLYTIYIRDINGCGTIEHEVALLNYPKFFTPNGDGANDTWRIKFSWFEPSMEIYIYDRYGKLITSFGPEYEGWDGTYNGMRLASTDYWFVVMREDGEVHKGHFSMIR